MENRENKGKTINTHLITKDPVVFFILYKLKPINQPTFILSSK